MRDLVVVVGLATMSATVNLRQELDAARDRFEQYRVCLLYTSDAADE